MGPLYPQGRFPLSRVEMISSKPLPARGLMGPSLPVVPAPSRCASGCQSGVAAGCLASPSRRRGPPGLPVCRYWMRRPGGCCLSPAAPGRCGARGRWVVVPGCQAFVSVHSRCCPAVIPCEARGGGGRGMALRVPPLAGTCITWAAPLLSRPECAGSKFSHLW